MRPIRARRGFTPTCTARKVISPMRPTGTGTPVALSHEMSLRRSGLRLQLHSLGPKDRGGRSEIQLHCVFAASSAGPTGSSMRFRMATSSRARTRNHPSLLLSTCFTHCGLLQTPDPPSQGTDVPMPIERASSGPAADEEAFVEAEV